jgi:GT2 family glycosyltransferase
MVTLEKFRTIAVVLLLLPFDLIVILALMVVEVTGRMLQAILGQRSSPESNIDPAQALKPGPLSFTIQILNWDGKHLLADCLPSVLEAARHAGGNHQILVVDNGSTDGSVEYLRANFDEVRVLALDRNYGFGRGNNIGAQSVHTDLIVFLNNDMTVDRNFLSPLITGFADPAIFAVTSQVILEDPARRREETGKTRGRFERGFFYLWHDEIAAAEEHAGQLPVLWAGGGSCAVDRQKFLAIGGFDALFRPAYVEDTDLSYQAWKRGWKCLLAPSSRVIHKHRATSGRKFGNRFVDNTIRKNQYLFIWKNITDFSMLIEHLVNLPGIHARGSLQMGGKFEIRAFVRAFTQLPQSLYRRQACRRHYRVSDRDALLRSQKL